MDSSMTWASPQVKRKGKKHKKQMIPAAGGVSGLGSRPLLPNLANFCNSCKFKGLIGLDDLGNFGHFYPLNDLQSQIWPHPPNIIWGCSTIFISWLLSIFLPFSASKLQFFGGLCINSLWLFFLRAKTDTFFFSLMIPSQVLSPFSAGLLTGKLMPLSKTNNVPSPTKNNNLPWVNQSLASIAKKLFQEY